MLEGEKIVAWLPERYQEKVFVEEENLQDYQKRREEEKVRNGKLHGENLIVITIIILN